MRLVGYSFAHASAPLDKGFVPLSDVTVLLGANDTGKTKLLGNLQWHLEFEREHRGGASGEPVFFLECGDKEFALVVEQALLDLRPERGAELERVARAAYLAPLYASPPKGDRGWWSLGVWAGSELDSAELREEESGVEGWLRVLRGHSPGGEGWQRLLDELGKSRVLAFEPDWDAEEETWIWNVSWCLPTDAERDGGIRKALSASGLWRPRDDMSEELGGLSRQASERANPREHLAQEGAPTLIAPIGRTNLPLLPVAVRVPGDLNAVREQAEIAIGGLTAHLRWADEDRLDEERGPVGLPSPAGHDAWLDTDDGGTTGVHEIAAKVCRLFVQMASDILPGFVRASYAFDMEFRHPTQWSEGRTDLRLRDIRTDELFAMEDVADGYRLWIELALLESIDALNRRLHLLAGSLESANESEAEVEELPFEDERYAEAEAQAARSREGYDELVTTTFDDWTVLPDPAYRTEHMIPDSLQPRLLPRWYVRLFATARSIVYFIDEPERHLHPRLQRQAARWLVDATREWNSQAVVTSHAVPFLNLGVGAGHCFLRRPRAGRTQIEEIDAAEIGHLSEVALELGFDRGELLALVNVLLFVEGRSDERVLTELFPSELQSFGIAVIPLHGYARSKGILDAEVLLRFTAAPAAVWLDRVSDEIVERLKRDPAFLRNALRDPTDEVRAMASLVSAAQAAGKEVEPLPHPGDDVFDLLDDRTITRLYPTFPGHTVAKRDWAMERERAGTGARKRKVFYSDEYGIPDETEAYGLIAAAMNEAGVYPAALREVIDRCERLALESSGDIVGG